MRLLLDTHIFWWAATAPERLSPTVMEALESEDNTLLLSAVVFWELLLKRSGKGLEFPDPKSFLPEAARSLGVREVLPVTARHILELESLPGKHRDPFDRILIAQARVERATLVTVDAMVRAYPVDVFPS